MQMLTALTSELYYLLFFNNYPFNQLIENGHVYLAQPPLFKVTKSNKALHKNENHSKNIYLKFQIKIDKKIKKKL